MMLRKTTRFPQDVDYLLLKSTDMRVQGAGVGSTDKGQTENYLTHLKSDHGKAGGQRTLKCAFSQTNSNKQKIRVQHGKGVFRGYISLVVEQVALYYTTLWVTLSPETKA